MPTLGKFKMGKESVSGTGFALVLPEPLISRALGLDNLAVRHAGGQRGHSVLATFVSASPGQDGPEICFAQVDGHAPSGPILNP